MKNKISDVRNHLVAMLEELGDKDAGAEVLERAKMMTQVAGAYVQCVKVELDGIELFDEIGRTASVIELPALQRTGQVLSMEDRRHG